MRHARLTTDNGISWSTSINGTDKEIREYFLGNRFDVGRFPKEDLRRVVKCEIDGRVYELGRWSAILLPCHFEE